MWWMDEFWKGVMDLEMEFLELRQPDLDKLETPRPTKSKISTHLAGCKFDSLLARLAALLVHHHRILFLGRLTVHLDRHCCSFARMWQQHLAIRRTW
jgi:hypothetical protein